MALDRENISDSLLILLLVLAADAVSGTIAGLAAGGDHLAAGEQAAPAGRRAGAGDSRRPAGRPYVDGSHDNSVFEQVFAYNGYLRFGDQTPLQVRAAELDPGAALPVPARAADRLLRGGLGLDTGWLIPAAAVVALWGVASRRRQPRGDPLRACFILWGSWLVTFFAVFSVITTLWPYYTAALSPAVSALRPGNPGSRF